MQIEILPQPFTVCQVADFAGVDLTGPFTFTARTDEERSLVCPTAQTPKDTLAREDGWRALRVVGALDFGLVGVLAGLASPLAAAGIPIFALSTYNTDYLLLKADCLDRARAVLAGAGHTLAGG